MGVGLVVLGPVLVVLTLIALQPLSQTDSRLWLTSILLADFVYVLVVATLIFQRVTRLVVARRARSAGSMLHLRLTGVFGIIALVPTVLVAIFAIVSINMGMEGWFSERVRNVVSASLQAAEAYAEEHRTELTQDTDALAAYLNQERERYFFMDDGMVRQTLSRVEAQVQSILSEAFVIDGLGDIRARGAQSYEFDFEQPTAEQLAKATEGEAVIIEDSENNEFRALVRLSSFEDRFLLTARTVDGDILSLLDDTKNTVGLYRQLEEQRGRLLFEFGLLYLGFALILVLAAIWMALGFAERLSRPVGRLLSASQRVGAGDLSVRVREEEGDDEIALLGRHFNQMTGDLYAQREALLDNTRQVEARRRLFDSVLSSVNSGVVGLDPKGLITFVNPSAERLLEVSSSDETSALSLVIPEMAPLLDELKEKGRQLQDQIKLLRGGKQETLLVRLAPRWGGEGDLEGYVVAFDDVTDLVSAQRMAAWGDVARRIAHEIKNPLTPIQLSAERIKRKYRDVDDTDKLEQMTDVIIRQTNDLRRIVDEFSRFARMPDPERRDVDLTQLLADAVALQDVGQPDVAFHLDSTPGVSGLFDETMISQALTNLLKNGAEAIETFRESGLPEGHEAQVRVNMTRQDDAVRITISDNGIGLPEDRSRLFEPYVTTREKGTGLGLPIVKKIIEDHGGSLELQDAERFGSTNRNGAMAVVTLPLGPEKNSEDK